MRNACLIATLLLSTACAQRTINPDKQWPPRSGHGMVSFDEQLVVMGGMNAYAGGPFYADVWTSNNGLEWEWSSMPVPHFSPRWLHGTAVFEGNLWVLGGQSDRLFNDVWRSENGVDWTLVTEDAPWAARRGHACVVHQDRLYLLGGRDDDGYLNDVWCALDGQQWELVTGSSPWLFRWHHAAVSFRGKVWIIGGAYGGTVDSPASGIAQDVWSSEDGIVWKQGRKPPFALKEHRAVVLNDVLYVLGGIDADDKRVNSVWFTRDGENWSRREQAPAWAPRSLHVATVHNRRLYVAGGIVEKDATTIMDTNDVWYTRDGRNWYAAGDQADLLSCLGCSGGCAGSSGKNMAGLGDWLLLGIALATTSICKMPGVY